MPTGSRALRRLAVVAVAAATAGAGLPVLLATSASAAAATQLSISPAPGAAAAGTCQLFTVTATDGTGQPATYSGTAPNLNVEVTENPVSTTESVSFCATTAPFANGGTPTGTTPSVTARRSVPLTRTPPAGGTVTASTPTTATFGLRGVEPGGASIRAFLDNAGGTPGVFDAGELQVQTSTTFTAGGINSSESVAGGNRAQDAVTNLTDASKGGTSTTTGAPAVFTVRVANGSGNTVSGVTLDFRVTGGPNGPQPASGSTAATPGASGSCDAVTDNVGQAVCRYPTSGSRTGTDTVQIYVNQTSGATAGPDAGEPTLTLQRTVTPAPTTSTALARTITLTPTSAASAAGTGRTFTATVVTDGGRPVSGVAVTVREEGPGRFADGSSQVSGTTDAAGSYDVTTTSVAGESGTQILTASITTAGTQCADPAGTPAGTTRDGNCSAAATQSFSATAPSPAPSSPAPRSPAPSTPPGSVPASPSPSASSTPPSQQSCTVAASVTLGSDTIIATGSADVKVRATPGSTVELYAYTRPSTAFRLVRSASLGADGTAAFLVKPPANTRLYAQQKGCLASPSVVLNVRTALSLFATRNGQRNYTFSGDSLPARTGGLIVSLYRVTPAGRQVLTSQTRASASNGQWRIDRRFTGEGRFGFVVRTGQDLQNAPGSSNVRPTLIY